MLKSCSPKADKPGWWNGIHARLKIVWAQALVGSSPTPGTNIEHPDRGVLYLCLRGGLEGY